MSFFEILLLALALSADAFSVAAVVGLRAGLPAQVFRLSLAFGLFQALLAAAGALLGSLLQEYVGACGRFVACGLLLIVGMRMLCASRGRKSEESVRIDPTRGWTLIGLSLAVSIDALGAGTGMAMVLTATELVLACLLIGAVASLAGWAGMKLGRLIQGCSGVTVEITAGVILVLLGIRMLWI